MDQILPFIEKVGVPAGLLVYVVYRIGGKIDTLSEKITALPGLIAAEFNECLKK